MLERENLGRQIFVVHSITHNNSYVPVSSIKASHTYVIFPKGWRTFIKSVSLQPSATARQWMTREGGVLWCAVEFRDNDCGRVRLEFDAKVETEELGDNE